MAVVGGPLRKYNVTLPGGRKTVMKLNEADAQHYDGTPVDGEPEPEATAAPAEEKADEGAPDKSRTPANKSRTARGKAAPGDG
ncbi:hypothetical protein [Streptomyces sp. ISL-94]|uniref:hypothetical protein n=1 Tax=Streptomyces sp. ISL-94 TaxID=2819190 RepID=UPI001BE946FC|nr:hypothetical protein [Streptomyces sp. ISL-94]MBT2477643.1 hypothetical protein [Streptomyces sp. ISL-94]